MKQILFILPLIILFSCNEEKRDNRIDHTIKAAEVDPTVRSTSLVILGTIQDAGSPQIGCSKACCKDLFNNPDANRKVVGLGVIDKETNKNFLFEATPDMISQCKKLKEFSGTDKEVPDGIFLTHAHIGHYTGLMYLGKEAMNADSVGVLVMPKMKIFLNNNAPWSQLVTNHNILLRGLNDNYRVALTPNITVIPFLVPHRDEFSETVGYEIRGPNKNALFIPDIDKWEKWDKDIIEEISKVDYAFLDATFYDGEELNNRDMSEIPHPFIVESMEMFKNLSTEEKSKIHFIHFNHTNPVINPNSPQAKTVIKNGFNLAQINDIFPL